MFAQSLSDWLARRGIHYGWVVALIAFLTMLTSSASLGLPGALLGPLSREFGWNIEQISSGLALRFALYGLMGPFAAILMERYGLRRVVVTALMLVAAGTFFATRVTQIWQLVMLWGVALGVGSGMTALVLGAVVATRWFDKRRGLVIGMLTASAATGQLIFLPAAAWLIEHHGWRMAVFPVCAACAGVVALAICFLRDRPSDIGLTAFGGEPEVPAAGMGTAGTGAAGMGTAGTRTAGIGATSPGTPAKPAITAAGVIGWATPFTILRSVTRNRTFWILFGTFFICGLSTNGFIQTHFISLCGDHGLGVVPAASVLAMMGAFDFFGTILSGWLSDRYDSRKLLFWYYGMRGLSLFWLPHSNFTLYGLSIFAVFYGMDWIATVPPTVKLAGQAFGKERAGMVFGWIFAGHQLGAATAAYGAGLSRTLLLTYTPAIYTAASACLIAALIALAIRRTAPVVKPVVV